MSKIELLLTFCIPSWWRTGCQATFSTQRGSWEWDDPLLGTVGAASPVIFQITPCPEGENRKDSIKRERTTSKERQYSESREGRLRLA